ncbi:MAG: gamma-glutamylputrescine oxidase [Gammaproteobacteria bacterium]|jgi:gamma-glutamylputrescine oxidase
MTAIDHDVAGSADYPPSYYAATANSARSAQPLVGAQTADICVVGAGYSGLSAAIHLAEKGYAVAVVEGARVGWGASGRNGGQIVNGLNAGLDSIARRYGARTEGVIGGLLQEGASIIYRLIEQYSIDCDLKRGNIYAAYSARHMRALRDKQALWRRHGMDDHELLDSAAIRQHVGSEVYCGGMLDRSGAHMQPLNLALGEARALESLGGRIFERSPVTRIDKSGDSVVVRTHQASITAKTVLLCGNAYLGRVVPALAMRVMPVSTQMIATEPLDAQHAAALIPTDHCVEDTRYILDYYRLSADKRMLFGGGVVYGGTDPADIVAKLRPNMHKVFPSLRGVGIDYAWSGNFALSFTRVPQLGRLDDGIYFAHGYSGHGVTGSHLFGSILAAAVDGDLSRFDTFAQLPWVPFPGGQLLRAPYSTLGSWWYGLRDKLGY